MRRAQALVPPGGVPKVLLATPVVPSLTEPAAAFATRHRTSAEFRAKLLFNLQKSSETVSRDVDYVVLGCSAASVATQSTPAVSGLHCQLECSVGLDLCTGLRLAPLEMMQEMKLKSTE